MADELEEVATYISECMERRQTWAYSPEGYKVLGPGSPTVPGMQEYFEILDFVKMKIRQR